MKFVVSSSLLLQHLQSISGVVTSKPVMPILDNFLFEIQDGVLVASASDLETFMTTTLPVQADGNIMVAVPSKMCLEFLRSLPDQPVTFTVSPDDYIIEVNSSNGRYKIGGQSAIDFPKIEEVETDFQFNIQSDMLLNAITQTLFATGNDELRLNLTGIYVELKEDQAGFVATDANRLVKYSFTNLKPGFDASFILPKKAANLLKSSLKDSEDVVAIHFNKTNAYFTYRDTLLVCRFIEDRYPDYNAVIPPDNQNMLHINREELLSTVKRISIMANKSTHQIRMKITGSEITISAEDMDSNNEGIEKLSCEYDGDDMEIGFNSKFLLDMLSNMPHEQVIIKLSSPNRAGILVPSQNLEGTELFMLVMPMMLNNY